MDENIWSELRYEETGENIINIFGWLTGELDETGIAIIEINVLTGFVTYLDERAKDDLYAQEAVQEVFDIYGL